MIYTHNQQQQQIIHAIAQLLHEFRMDFHTFCFALREHYVSLVYRESEGISRTSLKSGVDRRIVSSILKGEDLHMKRPLLLTIVDEIIKKSRDKNHLLPKNGINSMASIVEDVAYGTTTSKTVLDVLTETGIIQDHGEKFQFIGYPPPSVDDQLIEDFSHDLSQLVEDFIHRMNLARDNSDGNNQQN